MSPSDSLFASQVFGDRCAGWRLLGAAGLVFGVEIDLGIYGALVLGAWPLLALLQRFNRLSVQRWTGSAHSLSCCLT
jgi:hypothetical protein